MSNFPFYHKVYKSPLLQMSQNVSACGKGKGETETKRRKEVISYDADLTTLNKMKTKNQLAGFYFIKLYNLPSCVFHDKVHFNLNKK